MISNCAICGSLYNKEHAIKRNLTISPSVCSGKCFASLLKGNGQTYNPVTESERIWRNPIAYGQRKFRSSYEIRLSKWMSKHGIAWEFEPYIFRLDNGKTYMPDFYIHTSKTFVEVKGLWVGGAFQKLKEFKRQCLHTIILVDGSLLKFIGA